MANAQTIATKKDQAKMGIIKKSYTIKKELADEFKEVCDSLGVGQAATISELMKKFIEDNKEK